MGDAKGCKEKLHVVACVIGEGPPLDLLIDSGADVNVLTTADWATLETFSSGLCDVSKDPELNLRSYASSENLSISCSFKAWIRTAVGGKPRTFAEFVVVKEGAKSLLGRETAVEMKLLAVGLEVNHVGSAQKIERKFPAIPGVDEFVLPVRHAYVSIPVHYRQAATERLKEMERSDIIEPAPGSPRWISGMSAVPKGKGDFRLIVNMRGPNRFNASSIRCHGSTK